MRSQCCVANRVRSYMSLWSRIINVLRGPGLSREVDEELESHIAEAIEQGRDPAEARRAFGSPLRHRELSLDIRLLGWLDFAPRRRRLWLAPAQEAEGHFRRRDPVSRSGDRRLHIGIPSDRCAAVAPFTSGEPRKVVRSRTPGNWFRRQTSIIRRLGLPRLPPDARCRSGAGGADRNLL